MKIENAKQLKEWMDSTNGIAIYNNCVVYIETDAYWYEAHYIPPVDMGYLMSEQIQYEHEFEKLEFYVPLSQTTTI